MPYPHGTRTLGGQPLWLGAGSLRVGPPLPPPETRPRPFLDLSSTFPRHVPQAPPPAAEDICDVCGGASAPGDALLGCIDACGRLFHFGCLDNPPKRRPRSGALLCPECRAAAPARDLKEALKDSPAQKRARKAAPKEARPLPERKTLVSEASESVISRRRRSPSTSASGRGTSRATSRSW